MRVEEVIGRRLKLARTTQKLSQQEVGDRLAPLLGRAWTRQAVSAAEHGARDFTAVELVALAATLGVYLAWLIVPPEDVLEVELRAGAKLTTAQLAELFATPGHHLTSRDLAMEERLLRQVDEDAATLRQSIRNLGEQMELTRQERLLQRKETGIDRQSPGKRRSRA